MTKIAYLYDSEAAIEADRTFIDTPKSQRRELNALLEILAPGDTVMVESMGAFGNGQGVSRIERQIYAKDAVIELVRPKKRKRGRPAKAVATTEQREALCAMWYSAMEPGDVLAEAETRLGHPITRGQLDYMCGPRDGSKRDKKEASE